MILVSVIVALLISVHQHKTVIQSLKESRTAMMEVIICQETTRPCLTPVTK